MAKDGKHFLLPPWAGAARGGGRAKRAMRREGALRSDPNQGRWREPPSLRGNALERRRAQRPAATGLIVVERQRELAKHGGGFRRDPEDGGSVATIAQEGFKWSGLGRQPQQAKMARAQRRRRPKGGAPRSAAEDGGQGRGTPPTGAPPGGTEPPQKPAKTPSVSKPNIPKWNNPIL